MSKKIKTYIITLSRFFPVTHPRKGEPTDFIDNFIKRKKKHTIRGNYALWKKRIDEINAGNAVLHVKYWIGRPYHKPGQAIIQILEKGEVGIQPIILFIDRLGNNKGIGAWVKTDDQFEAKNINAGDLIKNDGLSMQDFYDWFHKPIEDPCVIHFTDLRY